VKRRRSRPAPSARPSRRGRASAPTGDERTGGPTRSRTAERPGDLDERPDERPDEAGAPPRRSARFAAALTALAVLVVGVVLVGFYPTRTWLRQEQAVHSAERDLAVLRDQNQELQDEAARLQDPAEIERLARAEYNLVRPGEQAYAIIPGGPSSTVPQQMQTVIEPDGRVHEVPVSTTPGYVARDPAAATDAAPPDTTTTTTTAPTPPATTPATTPASASGG
jgi:cell division protein FtsB